MKWGFSWNFIEYPGGLNRARGGGVCLKNRELIGLFRYNGLYPKQTTFLPLDGTLHPFILPPIPCIMESSA